MTSNPASARAAEAELDRIDAFLGSDRAPENAMSLSALDGYLTAIAVSPVEIPPEEWMGGLFGGDAPRFADEAEGIDFYDAVLARLDRVRRDLGGDPPLCEPVYYEDEDGTAIAEEWAEGFMFGVHLRADDWAPIVANEENVDLVLPMLALCIDDDGKPLLDLEEEEAHDLLDSAPDAIPEAVVAIHDFWVAERGPAAPARREGPKIGRNDPCPCGSGRKYKQCHGAE